MKRLLLLFFCFGWMLSIYGQANLPTQSFQNLFLLNPASSAVESAPRFDFIWQQRSQSSARVLSVQLPRLIRRDSVGDAQPIIWKGLGVNFLVFDNEYRRGFRVGLTKSLMGSVDSLSFLSNVMIGFNGGLDFQDTQNDHDFSASILYAKNGFQLGATTRNFWYEKPYFERAIRGYFENTTIHSSYYFVLGALERTGIKPEVIYFHGINRQSNLQFSVTADFWRDWDYGTPRLQTFLGYRTQLGWLGGISWRIVPRWSLNYAYQISDEDIDYAHHNKPFRHEISLSWNLGHKKRTIISIPIIEDPWGCCGGDTICGGYIYDPVAPPPIELEGKKYKKGNLINKFVGQVNFIQGTPELTDKSYEALDKLAKMMLINKGVRIEVGNHVDTVSNHFSLELTQKRSDAIKNYLQDVQGVELGRVVSVGFGRTRQEEGKKSERVEFKLIAITEEIEGGYYDDYIQGVVYKKDALINDFMGQEVKFKPLTAELTDESYEPLDKLAEMMAINKGVRIEVASYVNIDSLSDDKCVAIAQKRIFAIKSYLEDVKGVELGRVETVGYGKNTQDTRTEYVNFKLLALEKEDDE